MAEPHEGNVYHRVRTELLKHFLVRDSQTTVHFGVNKQQLSSAKLNPPGASPACSRLPRHNGSHAADHIAITSEKRAARSGSSCARYKVSVPYMEVAGLQDLLCDAMAWVSVFSKILFFCFPVIRKNKLLRSVSPPGQGLPALMEYCMNLPATRCVR